MIYIGNVVQKLSLNVQVGVYELDQSTNNVYLGIENETSETNEWVQVALVNDDRFLDVLSKQVLIYNATTKLWTVSSDDESDHHSDSDSELDSPKHSPCHSRTHSDSGSDSD